MRPEEQAEALQKIVTSVSKQGRNMILKQKGIIK
jgi:hypothetical protein